MVSKSQCVQKLTKSAASSITKDKTLSEHTGSVFKLPVNVADCTKACSKAPTFKPNPGLEGLNLSILQNKTLNKCAYASKKQLTKFSVSDREWTQSISNDQWAQFLGDQSLNSVELNHLAEKQGVYAESYEKEPSKLYGVGASHQGLAAFEPGLIRQFNAELIKDKDLSSHELYAIAQDKVAQSAGAQGMMIQGNQAELIPVTCEQQAPATKGSLVISGNEGEVTAPAPAAHSLVSLEFKFAYEALAGIEIGHTSLGALINQQLELTLGQFVPNAVILQELDKRLQARQQSIESNTAHVANTANAVNAGISNAATAHSARISETANTAESKQVEDGAAQAKDQTITALAFATASTTVNAITANAPDIALAAHTANAATVAANDCALADTATAITANAPEQIKAQAKVESKLETKGGIAYHGDKSKAKVSACCSAADVELEAELALAALAADTTITVFPFPASALQASTQPVTLTITTLTLAPNSAHAVADTAHSLEAATRSTLPNIQREEQSKDMLGNLEHLMSLVRFTQLQAARVGFFELRAARDKVKLAQAVQAANVDYAAYASHGKAVAYISDQALAAHSTQAHIKDPKQVQTNAQVQSLSQSSLAEQVPVPSKLQAQVKMSDEQLLKPHLSTQSNFSNLRAQYQFLQSVHENTGKSQSVPLPGSRLANAPSSAQVPSSAKAAKSLAIKAPFVSKIGGEQSAQGKQGTPYGSPRVAQQDVHKGIHSDLPNGSGESFHSGLSKVQPGLRSYAPGSKFEDEAMVAVAQALESLACLSKGRRVLRRKSEFEELAADILEDYDISRDPLPYKRKRNNNCVVKPVRMCLLQLVPMYTLQGDILSKLQGRVSLTFELPANFATHANLSSRSSHPNLDQPALLSKLSAHESGASHLSNSQTGVMTGAGVSSKDSAATVLGATPAVSSEHALVASQALELTSGLGLANVFSVAQVLGSTQNLKQAFTSSFWAVNALALREQAYALPLTASFLKQILVQSKTELTAIREKTGVCKIEPAKDETVTVPYKAQSQSCAFKSRAALLGHLINHSATLTGRDHSGKCSGKSAWGGAANAANAAYKAQPAFSHVRLLPTKDSTLELPATLRRLLEPEVSYQRTLTYLDENDILTRQQASLPRRLAQLINGISHTKPQCQSKADAAAKTQAKDHAHGSLSLGLSGMPCTPDLPKLSASNLRCEADLGLDGTFQAFQHDTCQQDTYCKETDHAAAGQAALRAVLSSEPHTPSEPSGQSGRNELEEPCTLGVQGTLSAQGSLGNLGQQHAQGQAKLPGQHYQKQSLGLSLPQCSLVFGSMSLLEPGDEVRTEQLVALLRHYHEVKQQKLYDLEQVQREAKIKAQSRRAVVEIALNQPGQFHPHHIMPDVQQFRDGLKPTVVSSAYVQQLTNACKGEDEAVALEAVLNQAEPEQSDLQQTPYLQGLAAAKTTVSSKTISSYDGSTQHILASIGSEAQDGLLQSSNSHTAKTAFTSQQTQPAKHIQYGQKIQSAQQFNSALLTPGLHSQTCQAAYAPKSVQNVQGEPSSQEALPYPVAQAEWEDCAEQSFQTAVSAMPLGLGNDSPLALGLEQDYATLRRLEANMDLDDPEVHTENLTLSKTFDFTVMSCVLGSDLGPALERLQNKVSAVIQAQALRQAKVQAQAKAQRLNVELVNAQGLTAIAVTPRNSIRQSVVGQSLTHAFTPEQDAHELYNFGQGNSAFAQTLGGHQPQVEVVTQHEAKFMGQHQATQQPPFAKSTTTAQPWEQIQSQLPVNSHAMLSALNLRSYGVMFEGVAELVYHDLPVPNERSAALFPSLNVSQAKVVTTLNRACEQPTNTTQDNLGALATQANLLVVPQAKTAQGNKCNECYDTHEVMQADKTNAAHKAQDSELTDAALVESIEVESTESSNQVYAISYAAKWSADFNSEANLQSGAGAARSGANANSWGLSDLMATGKSNLLAANVILNSCALDLLSGAYENGLATASQGYVKAQYARTSKIIPLDLSIANAYMQGTKQLIDESSQQPVSVNSTALASSLNISLDTAQSLSLSCEITSLIQLARQPDLKAEHSKQPNQTFQVEQNKWNASHVGSEDQFGVNDQALGIEWANAAKLANAMGSEDAQGEILGNELPIAVDLTHGFDKDALKDELKDKLNNENHEFLQKFKDAVKAVVGGKAEQNELLENLELEPVTIFDDWGGVMNQPWDPEDVFNERLLNAALSVNTPSPSNIDQSRNVAVDPLGAVALEDRTHGSKITGALSELDAAIKDGLALFNQQQEHADLVLERLDSKVISPRAVHFEQVGHQDIPDSHAVFSKHPSIVSHSLSDAQSYSQAPLAAEGYLQMRVRCESARKYYQVDVPYNSYQADSAGLTHTEQAPARAHTVNPLAKVSFDSPMALLDAALLFSKAPRFSDISHPSALDNKLCATVAKMPEGSGARSDIRTELPERNEHHEMVSESWLSGLALDSAKLREPVSAKAFTDADLSSVEELNPKKAHVPESVLAFTLNSHSSAQASQAPYAAQDSIYSPNLDAQSSSIQFVCDPKSNLEPSTDCSLSADSAMPHVALSAKDAPMLLSDGVRSYDQRAYPMPESLAPECSLVSSKGTPPDNIGSLAKDHSLAGLESAYSPLHAITQLASKLEPELETQINYADLQNWDNLPGFTQNHTHIHVYPLTYAHVPDQVPAQTHVTTQPIMEHACPDVLALPAQACPIVQVSSSWAAQCQAEVESVMGVEHAAVISELKENAQLAADAIVVTLNEEQATKSDRSLEVHAKPGNLHEAVLQMDAPFLSKASPVQLTAPTSYLSTSFSDGLELSHACDTHTVAHENLARAPKTFYADKLSDAEREQFTRALASRQVESGFLIQAHVGLQDEASQEIGLDFGDASFAYKMSNIPESMESIESTGIPELMPDKAAQVKTERMQVAEPEPYDSLAHQLIKPPHSQDLTTQNVHFQFTLSATPSHLTQTPRSSTHFQSAHKLSGVNPSAIFNSLSKFTELLHTSRNFTQDSLVESKSKSWSESVRLSSERNKTVSHSSSGSIPSLPQVNKQQCASILNSVNQFSELLQAASSASQNSIQSGQMASKSQSARDAGGGAGAVTGGRWSGLKAKFASMLTALGRERGTRLTLEVARPESELVYAAVSDMRGGQMVGKQGDSAAPLSEDHLYISLLADEMEHPFDGGGWPWLEQPWVNLTAEHQPLVSFEVCKDDSEAVPQLKRSHPDHEKWAVQKREHGYAQRAKTAKQSWFKNNWMSGEEGEEAVALVSGFAVPTPASSVQKVGAAETLAQNAGAKADAYAVKADHNLVSAELHFDPSLTRRWTERERGYANLSWGLGGADAAMSLGMFQTNHDYYQSFMTQAAIAYKQSSLIVDNLVSLWQAKLTRTYFDLQQATLGGVHLAQNLGLAQKLELSWFSSLSFVPECAETIKYMCQSCNQSPYQKAAQHLCGLTRALEQRDYFDVLQANPGVPASFEVLGR